MKKWLRRKNEAMIIALISVGLLMTIWTAHMVLNSGRMWFPS